MITHCCEYCGTRGTGKIQVHEEQVHVLFSIHLGGWLHTARAIQATNQESANPLPNVAAASAYSSDYLP